MKRAGIGAVVIALVLAASSRACGVAAAPADNAVEPIIETGDVDRFYKVYDEADVKTYYQHADDKRQAIRDILEMTNPNEFLAKSGWRPGVSLD